MPISGEFIGSGITFPFVINNEGRIPIDNGIKLLESSITTILVWPRFFRFFNEKFGGRVEELLGEPNDAILFSLIKTFTVEAISTWEPRVTLIGIEILDREDNKVVIELTYRASSIKQQQTFIFPFYTDIIY